MRRRRGPRHREVIALLHDVRSPHALGRNAFVRAEFVAQLPGLVDRLIDELGAESELQRRRFEVLRRSDVAREQQSVVAADLGLSRSQFYRDLHDARELFADALEDRLAARHSANSTFAARDDDTRFLAIEVLRNGGQYDRAREVASAVAHDADAPDAIRVLCLRAELEIESGSFAQARLTAGEARILLAHIDDARLGGLLGAQCDLVEFEAAHCQGAPAVPDRRSSLIDELRRSYGPQDREYAALLVKALIEEASMLFEQNDSTRALASIEEASSIVAHERLSDTR
ncbi:MAG TPA: hypothetical protein VIJ77_08660, partial [Candidatus Tumulicola sp.]